MNRDELIHIIRASAAITGETSFVIIGSQSILGSHEDLPDPLVVSMEADIYPKRNPEKAIAIDGAIGEGSMFQDSFGVYAHGVGPETAKCPSGWESRLVPLELEVDGQLVTAECLDPNDLVLAKCVAGRERDREFAKCALDEGVVDLKVMLSRVGDLPVAQTEIERVRAMLGSFQA
ncbi:MAG: hypothetical protein QM648_05880 [Solirubrobacterales bacterium]